MLRLLGKCQDIWNLLQNQTAPMDQALHDSTSFSTSGTPWKLKSVCSTFLPSEIVKSPENRGWWADGHVLCPCFFGHGNEFSAGKTVKGWGIAVVFFLQNRGSWWKLGARRVFLVSFFFRYIATQRTRCDWIQEIVTSISRFSWDAKKKWNGESTISLYRWGISIVSVHWFFYPNERGPSAVCLRGYFNFF